MKRIVAIIVLILHFGALIWVLNMSSADHFQLWRQAQSVEAEVVNFTFDHELQGMVTLSYQVDGQSYQSDIDGYFSDFTKGKPLPILVSADNPKDIYWKSAVRFWFWEIVILVIWGLILMWLTSNLIPAFRRHRRIAIGITLIGVALLGFAFLQRQYKSIKDFKAAGNPVAATVESVAEDTCSRSDARDNMEEYTCYKPTYVYTIGQETHRYEVFWPIDEKPAVGQEQELWYWKQNPSVARDLSTMLSRSSYIFLMVVVIGLFLFGLRNLLPRRKPY